MPERFSASAAPRLMQCAASGNLDTSIPGWVPPVVDHTAGAKGKGSEIHTIFEAAMQYTARDLQCIADAMAYVSALRSSRRFKVLTEATVRADWLPSAPITTVDLVLYVQDEIHIVDYKTGKIFVDAKENNQLMFYAASFAHLAPKAEGVHLHVVQPWADNMTEWYCLTDRLGQFMAEARAAESLVTQKVAQFQPGDHCTFCPANPRSRGDKGRPFCPAMMQLYYPSIVDEEAILDV